MMKLKFLFLFSFALFLTMPSERCFSQEVTTTTFKDQHACDFSASPRAGWCKVRYGNSLSGIVHIVTGSWTKNKALFLKDNPKFAANPDFVKEGDLVYFSDLTVCNGLNTVVYQRPRSKVHTTTATAFAPAQLDNVRHATIEMEAPSDIAMDDGSSSELAQAMFASGSYRVIPAAPDATIVTVAKTETASSAFTATPTSVTSVSEKKLTGYQFVIPHSRAFRVDGTPIIPMNVNLPTEIGIFNDPEDPRKGIAPQQVINTTSRVSVQKDGDKRTVVLTFLMPQRLPSQPFVFHAYGMVPIGGGDIALHATPFYGRLPAQHHLLATLFTGGSFVGTGLMLTAVSGNPFVGFGIPAASWGARTAIHSIRKKMWQRAEAKYQARIKQDQLLIAERQNTQKEESRHAE